MNALRIAARGSLGILPRIAAQGLLAISSYLVSVTAAHTLEIGPLAVFFVGWAAESIWIGAIRMVLVPPLLLRVSVPHSSTLIGLNALLSLPIVVFVAAYGAGRLGLGSALLLGLSVTAMGSYEVARSLLARLHARAGAVALSDGLLLGLQLLAASASIVLGRTSILASLGALLLAAAVASGVAVAAVRRSRTDSPARFRDWLREAGSLLRLGALEWVVFSTTSGLGLALISTFAGAPALAGVRLAESLVAPIGLVSSALPMLYAASLRDQRREELGWPRLVTVSTSAFELVSLAYILFIQFGPPQVLELLVGDHVRPAREANLGLALGIMASIFSSAATLVMKHRDQTRPLAILRWIGLGVSIPSVALGSMTGTAFGAGLGISTYQAFPAVAQAFLHRRELAVRENEKLT